VEIGLFVYATELGCPITEVGALGENYQFESLFVCEHSHVPAPPAPYLDPGGKTLPVYYSHLFDPLITLAALASATTTLTLGTAICIAAQRDPITTAKEIATLDHVSRGRIEFGVGTGWSHDESRAHGVDPGAVFATLRSNVMLMRQLWTRDSVELPGTPQAGPIAQWPRPYRQPHPPVLIAGNGPRILQRVEEFGDGWLVTYRHPDLLSACAELRALRERTGKPYPVTMVAGWGDPEILAGYAALGIDRALVAVLPGTLAETEDRIAAIAGMRDQVSARSGS
jgi:probable F420-dependent oxidoreductase